jgi:peptidoglycan/LPS O-acetylase OafA/YrhL
LSPHGYRPALDGLRAIAVSAVILYHLGYRWAPGGFLGVDLFFVLSGYLITSILIAGFDQGRLNLASFWARRVRRLLPAVLVLCVVIAAVINWTQPYTEYDARQADLLWTIFYAMNWHLIASAQDYFAQYLGASPLRHAWSLAIEEQFYLLWPVAILLIGRAFRRSRAALAAAVALGVVLSAAAMAATYDPAGPSRAYYGTDGRIHQLLVGALLALGLSWLPALARDRGKLAGVVAIAGAASLATAFALVHDSWSGYYLGGSLILAFAVAAVLWAVETHPTGFAARVLGIWPLRWLGQISYGVYLWHWPVILLGGAVLTKIWGPSATALLEGSTRLNAARIVAAIAIAATSYYLIEQPIRRGWIGRIRVPNRWSLAIAPTPVTAVAVVCLLLTTLSPAQAAEIDRSEYSCATLTCVRHIASAPSRPTIAVVGDSTGRSLDAGMLDLSSKWDWTYVATAQGGCSIMLRSPISGGQTNSHCPAVNETIRARLLGTYRPTLISAMERFLLADYLTDAGEVVQVGSAKHLSTSEEDLYQAVRALTSGGAMLVFFEILPVGLPIDCSSDDRRLQPDCQVRASSDGRTADYNLLIRRVAARSPDSMRVVSLAPVVCPDDLCSPRVDGVLLRYDRIHFTHAGARWLAPRLYDRLVAAGLAPPP